MSTTTSEMIAHLFLNMEQTDRLIYALQKAKRAARRDVATWGHEGIEARVMLSANAQANGSTRLDIETMESWIASFAIDDMDADI